MSDILKRFDSLEKKYKSEEAQAFQSQSFTDSIQSVTENLENDTETQGADVATEKATNFFDKAKAVGTFIGAFTLAKNKPYIDAVVNPIKEGTKEVGKGLAQTFPSAVPATFPTAVPKQNVVAGAINTVKGAASTAFGVGMTGFNLGMESARQAGLGKPVEYAEKIMNAGAEGFSQGVDIMKDNLFGVKGSDKRKSVELAMNYLGLEPQEMSEIYQASKGAGELLTTIAIFHGAGKGISSLKNKIKGKPIAEKQQIIIEEAKTFSKNENWQNKVLGVEKQLTQNAGKSNFPDVVGTIPNFTITGDGSKVQSFYPPKDKYFDSPKQTIPLTKEQGSPFAVEEVKNTIKIDESTVKDLPTLDELQKSTPKGIDSKLDKGIINKPEPITEATIDITKPKTRKEAQILQNLSGAKAIKAGDQLFVMNDVNHKSAMSKAIAELGNDKFNELFQSDKVEIGHIENGQFVLDPFRTPKKKEAPTPELESEVVSEQPKQTLEVNTGKELPNKSEMEQKKVEGAKENQSEMPDKQTFGQNDLAPKNVIQEKVQGNENVNKRVYRQASLQEIDELVNPNTYSDVPMGTPQYYVSTSKDLALGQGKNKNGAIIEIANEGLDTVNPKNTKPGAEFVESQKGGVEQILKAQPSEIKKNVVSIEIPKNIGRDEIAYKQRLKNVLKDWDKTETEKSTIYKNPKFNEGVKSPTAKMREREQAKIAPTIKDPLERSRLETEQWYKENPGKHKPFEIVRYQASNKAVDLLKEKAYQTELYLNEVEKAGFQNIVKQLDELNNIHMNGKHTFEDSRLMQDYESKASKYVEMALERINKPEEFIETGIEKNSNVNKKLSEELLNEYKQSGVKSPTLDRLKQETQEYIKSLYKRGDTDSNQLAKKLENKEVSLDQARELSLKIAERKVAETAKALIEGRIKRAIEKTNKPIRNFDESIKQQSEIAKTDLIYDYDESTSFGKDNQSRSLTLIEGKNSLSNLESISKPNFLWGKEVEQAYKNIQEKSLGRANLFADPTIIKDYATVGYHAIKQGFKKFSDWSAKMIEIFTEKIKPHLLRIWDSVKKEFGKQLLELDAKNPFSMTKSIVEGNPFLDRQKAFKDIQEKKTKTPTEVKEEIASDIGVEVKKNLAEKVWDFALTKSETRLRGFGKAGNELADKFKKALEIERDNAGKGEQYLYDMNKLSKEELKNLEDIEKAMIFQTKGSGYNNPIPKPISKNVENIVNGVNAYYKDAFNRAKEAGLEVNELPNYRPRILNIDLKDLRVKKNKEGRPLISDKRKQILEKMVEEGTAKNIADASFILDNYIAEKSTKKSTHLEYSRTHPLPKKYYITDPKQTLLSYVLDAEKRIANAKEFGVKDELVKDIYESIRKESGEDAMTFAQDVFKYETGKLSPKELKMLENINLVKGFQTVTKFSPFTTLRNSLQGILGSSIRGNFQTAFRGLLKSFTNEVERNAYKSGALHDQISKIITKEMGGAGKITDSYLKLIGFTKTDIVNRIIASASGEAFYTDMLGRLKKDSFLKKRAIREFDRMGLDSKSILERGKFNESELNLIRRTFAGDTQFNVRPIDLPLFWSSPTGKLLTQWKSFGYKMGEMVYKNVIGEAKKGNLVPLTTMLVAYGVSGEAVNMIIDYTRGIIKGDFTGKEMVEKSLLGGDLESNEVFVRILTDVAGLGALGIFVDMIRSFGYGKSGATSAVLGPVVGETVQILENNIAPIGEALNKGTTKNLAKNTVKGVLNTAERNLVPGSGTFRTFGLWKWINEQVFPKSNDSRTSSRISRPSRTSRESSRN